MSRFIKFEVPCTMTESYELRVPPEDKQRVALMDDDELRAYINDNSSEWEVDTRHSSDTVVNGEPEEIEVYDFNSSGPHIHVDRP